LHRERRLICNVYITDVTDNCAKNAKVITFIDNINIKSQISN